MQLYREKSTIWDLFANADIHSIIAPFGLSIPYKQFEFKNKCKLICRTNTPKKCNKQNVEIRATPLMHVKLAIGTKGVLFGSFNFSRKSKSKELVAYFDQPSEIFEFQNLFNYWWDKAMPVKP